MKNVYRTKTGIEIGCMYEKPLPTLNEDELWIQRVLLGIRGPNYLMWVTYIIFLVVLFSTMAMTLGAKR